MRAKITGLKILIALMSLILPFFLLEIGARLFGIKKLSDQERFAIVNEQQLNPDDHARWCTPPAPQQETEMIFAFGGSSVFGCCGTVSYDQAFPAELERKLKGRENYLVKSYALSGKDSFYHRRCVERLTQAGAHAEYWIYYAGHNDFINGRVGNPRISIFLQKNPVIFRVVNWLLKSSHVAGYLRDHSAPAFPRMGREEFIENKNEIFNEYARNLTATHEMIKASGGKLILITVVSNLEHPPLFRENLESTFTPEENALKLFELGLALKAANPKESLEKLKLARDWDQSAWRAPSEVNQFIRKLAADNPDSVYLLDLEEIIDSAYSREGVGCNFFGEKSYCDHLHPNLRLHREIATYLELLLKSRAHKIKAAS